eukprot:752420-Hanusia_phi.AAC.3
MQEKLRRLENQEGGEKNSTKRLLKTRTREIGLVCAKTQGRESRRKGCKNVPCYHHFQIFG